LRQTGCHRVCREEKNMKTLRALDRVRSQDSGIRISAKEDFEPSGSLDGLAVSEEEYWDRYYNYCEGDSDFSYEWNNGYLEEKPVADFQSSMMYRWFLSLMECYFSAYPIGIMSNFEIGFRLALPHDTSIRKPDLGVVLHDNAVTANPGDSSFRGTFDLCVESLSYSSKRDIVRDTVQKKREYAGGGVREYYILDARGKKTAFYRLNKKGKYTEMKPGKDGIVRSEVLPEFQFEISDLYAQPSLEKLSEKEVYRHYVLPFYQKARQEAEAEKQRAEQEKRRAEQEKQRADQAEKRFLEAARSMLANGLDMGRIMKYTGLSAEELALLSETNP